MKLFFIAIVAPEDINDWLIGLKEEVRELTGAKKAFNAPAHITLYPPFRHKNEGWVRSRFSEFDPDVSSFYTRINGLGRFDKRVLHIEVEKPEEMSELFKKVNAFAVNDMDLKPRNRKELHPHMTIAHRDLQKKDFDLVWAHFADLSTPEGFLADNVSLLIHDGKNWHVSETIQL